MRRSGISRRSGFLTRVSLTASSNSKCAFRRQESGLPSDGRKTNKINHWRQMTVWRVWKMTSATMASTFIFFILKQNVYISKVNCNDRDIKKPFLVFYKYFFISTFLKLKYFNGISIILTVFKNQLHFVYLQNIQMYIYKSSYVMATSTDYAK